VNASAAPTQFTTRHAAIRVFTGDTSGATLAIDQSMLMPASSLNEYGAEQPARDQALVGLGLERR
jgi:hypothetical protein